MKFVEEFESEVCEECGLPIEIKSLEIFTNIEAKPNDFCNWFYEIVGEDLADEVAFVEENNGFASLCDCRNCNEHKNDILELISVCKALEWVVTNEPDVPVTLWVSSELLCIGFEEKERFYYEVEFSNSCLLKTLAEQFDSLLSELDVNVFHYCYGNKDLIHHFFESK